MNTLTDTELSVLEGAGMSLDNHTGRCMVAAVKEIREARAARQADEERVRFTVRDELLSFIVKYGPVTTAEEVDIIAARVASQLASGAPVLSAEERDDLMEIRDFLLERGGIVPREVWKREFQTLDRLLGASR